MKIIVRQNYVNQLISIKDNLYIKIIIGIKRCGTSQLMLSFLYYSNYK